MRFPNIGFWAGAISALVSASATATPVNLVRQTEGYTYFSRPHADMNILYQELAECLADVRGESRNNGYGPVQGLLGYSLAESMRNGMTMVSLENCMVFRGWRVIRLDSKEGEALSHLPNTDLAARLGEWVGADEPHGQIVRTWANDLTKPDTIRSAFPNMTVHPSLSVLAVPKSRPSEKPDRPAQRPNWPYKMNIFKQATTDQLAHIPAGSAVIVVTLRNSAPTDFVRLKFLRIGPNQHDPASFADGQPDTLWVTLPRTLPGTPAGARVQQTMRFVVPAGRWAVYAVSDVMTACLNAPYFEIAAGDVAYTGTLDFGVDGLPWDPSLEPARLNLTDAPTLQSRVAVVQWINGAVITCPGTYAYALEFPFASRKPDR